MDTEHDRGLDAAAEPLEGRVLVIDDNAQMLDVFRQGLKAVMPGGEHIEFLFAEDAYKGLDLFAKQPVDIVILDLRMPGMDGMQILATLRESHQECEVIIHTAYADVDVAIDALNAGAFAMLRKPCPMTEICGVVRNALEKVQRQRAEKRRGRDHGRVSRRIVGELLDTEEEFAVILVSNPALLLGSPMARELLDLEMTSGRNGVTPDTNPRTMEFAAQIYAMLHNDMTEGGISLETPEGKQELTVRLTPVLDDARAVDQVLVRGTIVTA
ncbi:MAG: response regulator [Kiritimatiellae bacterium]|nr:response regulator [Kiritimatiellia bacterium]